MQRGSHASKHEGEKLRYKDQGPSSRQKGRVLELEGGQQLVLIWEREGERGGEGAGAGEGAGEGAGAGEGGGGGEGDGD